MFRAKNYVEMTIIAVMLTSIFYFMLSLPAANATYSSMIPISPILPPPITQIQVPGEPISLSANVVSSSEIGLSWNPPSSNGGAQITGYEIDRDSGNGFVVLVQNTGSTLTSYQDKGLDAARTYSYRVSAINSAGTSIPSNAITETTFPATVSSTQPSPIPLPPVTNPSQSSSAGSSTSSFPVTIDYVIKIDGIQGESQIPSEAGAIDVEGWSWGAVNPNSANFQSDLNQAVTWIRPGAQDIHFTKFVDKASPKLMLACANGQHIANIEIDGLADVGQGPQVFLKITLHDVLVSSYQISGSGSESPMESISLNFAKMDQPAWDQKVLQTAADQRMALPGRMKSGTLVPETALTAPTPKPTNQFPTTIEFDLHTSGQPNSIEINSFSLGVTNEGGKVSQLPLTFTPKAGTPTSFITVTPPDGLDYRIKGGPLLLSFSFGKALDPLGDHFQTIEMNYGSQKVEWDFQANAPINEQQLTSPTVPPHKTYVIPAYERNVAKLWAKGEIDDTTFETALQYLIDKGIVQVPVTNQTSQQSSGGPPPNWVRNLAGYYGDNQISDNDFGQAIEYMLNHDIINMKVTLHHNG